MRDVPERLGAELNAAAGMSLANNRPGCSSHRVCVRRTFTGLAGVAGAAFVPFALDASFWGVRAGRIEEVGLFLGGSIVAGGNSVFGGRIAGGIPGGGPGGSWL